MSLSPDKVTLLSDETPPTCQRGDTSEVRTTAAQSVPLLMTGPAKRPCDGLVALGGLALIVAIAGLDYRAGSRLSLSLFYLLPIAVAAWRGGFAHGILLSLASTLAWYMVDELQRFPGDSGLALWNGVVRFGTFVIISSLLSKLRLSMHREQLLARTDPLTGALNCRTFHECIAVEVERSLRTGQPLSLAYFDLDNFKQLNDRLGHLIGDQALYFIVQSIRRSLRVSDHVARLGGDEFGLLLPSTGEDGAIAMLSRLQRDLSQQMARKGWPVTVSIGAATFLHPPRFIDQMVQHVDSLMYRVKKSGKNRILHEMLPEIDGSPGPKGPEVERRAETRIVCRRMARISVEQGAECTEEIATVLDLSCSGIGLQVVRPLSVETLLTIESLHTPGTNILIARVVHVTARDGGWFHGCQLTWPLSEEGLQSWLGNQGNGTVF